jgi:hypothetical protein
VSDDGAYFEGDRTVISFWCKTRKKAHLPTVLEIEP